MNEANAIRHAIQRYPWAATAAYAVIVGFFVAGSWLAVADIVRRQADIAAARAILDQLQARKQSSRGIVGAREDIPTGSPMLEGPTVTVAGASLLQRVAGAVTKVGGNILSSQVELDGLLAKTGFVGVIANCELDQQSLQMLLYDLEAGMPLLYIDQLVVQAPSASIAGPEPRMRILLTVSGQWQGAK
jgi:general secretion pathway protein M